VVIDAEGRARLVDFGRASWRVGEDRRPEEELQDRNQLDAIESWLVHDIPLHRRFRRSAGMRTLKIVGTLVILVTLVKCRW
jgi:hypothetical protein